MGISGERTLQEDGTDKPERPEHVCVVFKEYTGGLLATTP